MIYIGIDNGLGGGIAAIDENQNIVCLKPMPVIKGKKTEYVVSSVSQILIKLKEEDDIFCVLEKAHVRPISGKRACFMTGYGYGMMEGILTGVGIRYRIVNPREWQKSITSGLGNDTKSASINFCLKQFPGVDLTLTERSKKHNDGLSDALCMATYCYEMHKVKK